LQGNIGKDHKGAVCVATLVALILYLFVSF